MNFLKQIEASLKAIDQARFQDLVNHLLHVQGYTFIGAPGSVVAKEKTSKGAPDSFFIDGDKFIFVECTTQERLGSSKTFLKKLEKDITHCFDENKTGIKGDKIEKIILACTDKISPNEFNQLKNKVKEFNITTTLKIFDIQNLPNDIYDFPGLSEQYLGVVIVKGEIYNLPDFLTKTTKGLHPPLNNSLVGREEEVKRALEHLENIDILLLSGAAGVGKSKLAVAILSEKAIEGYIPIVIQSSAVPLWDDFVHLFQNGKNYIILFDDANKSVQNLTYLLDFIQKPKTNKLKVIITARDYVKQQVSQRLNNSRYREIVVDNLEDKNIEEIIIKALPNLQYHFDIKRKIVALAKGNARMALMATYSVNPDAETNYLSSPVQLYERYFEKIVEEIEAFSKPTTLQALAIVSFFGVLNRKNASINEILRKEFNLDFDEIWATILELHRHEILDVYANEVVRVSDQVLATYAFYKCFMDEERAVIDYARWIATFINEYSFRIRNTLIDINNTFNYHHIRDLVLPHLKKIIPNELENEALYSFYSVFWFYTGYETLIYLRQWINGLPEEYTNKELDFSPIYNKHTTPTRYFELLVNFWDHPNELLEPALNLAIDLVVRQPTRLPEFLQSVNGHFSYKWEDVQYGYQRQNILLDTLLNKKHSNLHKKVADGTFLNIIEKLLGWHFTEIGPSKGKNFTIAKFDLFESPELLALRNKILEGFFELFEEDKGQSNKTLEKILFPGGLIDKQIYVLELPIYNKLISGKLSNNQYAHCKFVKGMAEKIATISGTIPDEWNSFIESDIMQLARLLRIDFHDRKGKTWQESENEKREEIQAHISYMEWHEIHSLLCFTEELHRQKGHNSRWSVDAGISEIFIAISRKSKDELIAALKMFFGGKLSFPLQTRVVNFILNENVLSGKELISLIDQFEFREKMFWTVELLKALPDSQIDIHFVDILIRLFKNSNQPIPIYRMLDFIKYDSVFEKYKVAYPETGTEQHNIISYLTAILLSKQGVHKIDLGFDFCQDCAPYLSNHSSLLKLSFIYLKRSDNHFDYDGKEFEAVLKIDNDYFIEYLEKEIVDFDFLSFRLEDFKFDIIWSFPNHKEVLDKAIRMILSKHPVYSNSEHPSVVLFTFRDINEDLIAKAHIYIANFINEHFLDKEHIKMIFSVVLHRFPDMLLKFLRQFLVLNKDIDMFKGIWLNKGEVYTGSRVPYIQRELDFCDAIIIMVKTLPDVLNYAEHLKYLDQIIVWLKKDIDREKRRDFEESYG